MQMVLTPTCELGKAAVGRSPAALASGTHEDNEENLFSVFTDEEGSL